MIRIRMAAVTAAALSAFALVLAPAAAHAETTDPPACVESPYGGCQTGPLGNGTGGGGWGPWGPGGPLDYYAGYQVTGSEYWAFSKRDGSQVTDSDAFFLKYYYNFDWCSAWPGPDGEILCR